MKSLLTWSFIGRTLNIFGEKTFGIYMWVTPLLVYIIDFISNRTGWRVHLPKEIGSTFLIGGLFILANVLYRWHCPDEHRNVLDVVSMLERVQQENDRLTVIMDAHEKTMQSAKIFAENTFVRIVESRKKFTTRQLRAIKPILVGAYTSHVDNARTITQALYKSNHRDFDALEIVKPLARYFTASILGLSILGAGLEFLDKLIDVIKATL